MSPEQTDERSEGCVALQVSIGRAARGDCNEIAALEETVFVADAYGEKEVRQFLERFPALCLAARAGVDGRLAGYALCGGRATARHSIVEQTGWLNSLAVREDLRGRGLGARLLDATLVALRHAGLTHAMLYAQKRSFEALGLYRSRGFLVAVDPYPAGEERLTLARALR